MDSLSAFNAFVRAAEARSYTEAGRLLNVSPSAVTKAVSRLEERLGVRLFHRNTRGLTLTQEGALFLDSCYRIFSEIDAVHAELAHSKITPMGRLKVSLPMVGELIMPAISDFVSAYPDIELDLNFTDHLVNIVDDGYDVVIRTGKGADSGLISRPLGAFHLRIVGSPAYLERAGMPIVPRDLMVHACLHHRYATSGRIRRWPLEVTTTERGLVLPVAVTSTAIEPLITLAERGNGLACLPDFAIRQQIADGRLIVVLDEYMTFASVLCAVWPSNRFIAPKVRAFVDFLTENLFPRVDG
ncbi:LysR family transcriptional regulator [Luteibacter sp. OK325]|uniref:LysR family transcriptional regulator n=1 Tax=Luteibacter sp. OK325 TaxID=2135670 RepID=UPI000D35590B|nr:LysR family transcriptional regulator [Luteibacter sp. OK325]PTR34477.1 LysR family transcriptional regulator [Luteibacter sp. OK325]